MTTAVFLYATLLLLGAEDQAAKSDAPSLSLQEVLASATAAYPLLAAVEQRRILAAAELQSAEGSFDTLLKTRASSLSPSYYQHYTVDTTIEQPTTLWGSTFFGGYRWGRGDVPSYYGNLQTARGGEVRAGVSVPLLRNGSTDRRRTAIEQATLGQKLAQGDIDLVRIDVRRGATYRYWDWVLAGRRRAIAQELLAIAQARDQAVHRRSEVGDVAKIDKVDNERAIAERTERLIAADRVLEQAAIALSLFLRDSAGRPVRPTADRLPNHLPEPQVLDEGPITNQVDRAMAARPELVRLSAQRKQQEAERSWAQNQALPAVDLSLVGSRDIGQGDPRFERSELAANVMVDVPLQRRVAKGRERAAGAAIARLQAEEQMAKDRIEADVRDSQSALQAAFKRVGLARQQRALAVQLEKAERTRFELGESNLLLVNLREQASADAALAEAEALGSSLRSQADYQAALADFEN